MRTQALDYDTNAEGDKSGIKCTDKEKKTIQSAAAETDINLIVKRMGLGQAAPVTTKMPIADDYDEVYDYRTALERVMQAERAFMELPAATRYRFENDPQKLMDFLEDPGNGKEAVALGLATARVVAPEAPKEGQKPKDAPK